MGIYQGYVSQFGSARKAATALGIPKTTFLDRLNKEKPKLPLGLSGITDQIKYTNSIKIVYFTDAHNQPGLSQDRFKWLAHFVNTSKPQILVDGGDFDDFGSLCTHEKNDTYKGKLKPSLAKDLEASAQARAILKSEIKHPCRQIVTLGNHEDRIWRYEDANPEMYGIPSSIYLDILKATGWEYVKFKETINVSGVDVTHVPYNKGKEFGGENAARLVAKAAQRDTLFGHIHELQLFQDGKLSDSSVIAFCGGCFMPDGYIPSYARKDRKEYFYGAHEILIRNGRIKSIKSFHISELEDAYNEFQSL